MKAWEKLSCQYASKFMVNKLILLSNQHNMKLKNNGRMSNHTPHPESQLFTVAAMGSAVHKIKKLLVYYYP